MSDPETSGAATPAAETVNTPSAPANPTPSQTPGTFGNTRGSGLARGKRPSGQSAQAPSTAPAADYKPTAVSILTAPTEYKNPFAPPAPAEEAKPAAPNPPPSAEPAPAPAPVAEAPAATPEPAPAEASEGSSAPGEPEPKAELKILPPETPKRVEHSWESRSFRSVAGQPAGESHRPADGQMSGARPRRDERPVFRPDRERRADRPNDFRAAGGEPGRGGESRRPSAPPPPPAASAEEKKAGGLFGWVKKIFGNGPAEAAPPPPAETRGEGDYGRPGGGHRRRRHRGGRGRNFRGDQQGPREGQSGGQYSGEPRGQGGEHSHYGRRRRRHRGGGGGGGGYRGDRGDRGDSRPEGGPPAGS